ncbi:MAG: hypothetical protein KBT48_09330 [Firmicutes bacterium]|nr:hypothetical protein [Bacillota bacterium]
MFKNTNKLRLALCSGIIALGVVGCANKQPEEQPKEEAEQSTTAQVVNPMEEVTQTQLLDKFPGIDFCPPQDAQDAIYSIIHEEDMDIPQMTFTLDNIHFTERAVSTELTDLSISPDMKEGFDPEHGNISGMYTQFNDLSEGEIGDGTKCILYINDETGEGVIAWLDTHQGMLYNLSMDSGATKDSLIQYANMTYIPVE